MRSLAEARLALRPPDRAVPAAETGLRPAVAFLVAAFVFTIPFEDALVVPAIGSVTRLLGFVILPLAVLALFRHGRVRLAVPPALVLLTAAFALWNLASWFWSRVPNASLDGAITFAQLFLFVWLVSEFARDRAAWERLMQAFVLGAYVAFAMTAGTALGLPDAGFRNTGSFDANEFATILALGVPMAAWLIARHRPGPLHLLNLAYPVVATFGVVLGASRGGLLVLLLALTAIPFTWVRLGPLRRLWLTLALLVAAVGSFVLAPIAFPQLAANLERLGTTDTELAGGTLTGRTVIWAETWAIIQDAPVLGVGSRAARHVLAERAYEREKAVHNAYLTVAAETGLVGFALFAGVLAVVAASVVLSSPATRPYAVVLLLSLLLAMTPLSIEARKYTWFVLALLGGLVPFVLRSAGDPAVAPSVLPPGPERREG